MASHTASGLGRSRSVSLLEANSKQNGPESLAVVEWDCFVCSFPSLSQEFPDMIHSVC